MGAGIAKLGGKWQQVSGYVMKILNGSKTGTGVFRTSNGFTQKIVKAYDGPGAVLTNSFKQLKDGRTINQRLWSWADGSTYALTTKSDGFMSLVHKGKDGKIISKMISRNADDLAQSGMRWQFPIGQKARVVPYTMQVNGSKYASTVNGQLVCAGDDISTAQSWVRGARDDAELAFRQIG